MLCNAKPPAHVAHATIPDDATPDRLVIINPQVCALHKPLEKAKKKLATGAVGKASAPISVSRLIDGGHDARAPLPTLQLPLTPSRTARRSLCASQPFRHRRFLERMNSD
jgi:hypothetical protein